MTPDPGGTRSRFWLAEYFVTKEEQLTIHPKLATETAEKLAQKLDTPFVSVDLLEGVAHPYFEEFTPAPGGGGGVCLGTSEESNVDHDGSRSR